jgi:uncharacterized protein
MIGKNLLITGLCLIFCLSSCSNLDNAFLFLGAYSKTEQYDFSTKFSSIPAEDWKLISVPTQTFTTDGLWIKGEKNSDTLLNNKVFLFFNGNDGTIDGGSDCGLLFRTLGVDFFSIDFRGYGRSTEIFTTSETSCYEDGVSAMEFLHDSLGYSFENIILVGYSMGGGVATELATRYKVNGLILMSTFTTIDNMVEAIGGGYNIPGYWLVDASFDNLSKIDKINMPVFITCGDKDMLIDPENSSQLYNKALSPKGFYSVKNGTHPQFPRACFDSYRGPLTQFLHNFCM